MLRRSDLELAKTGITESEAWEAGIEVGTVTVTISPTPGISGSGSYYD